MIILALEKLRDDVVAVLANDGTFGDPLAVPAAPDALAQAGNPFGWRETGRQRTKASIVWVPGDDKSGSLGELQPPRYPGRIDPGRPLGTLDELFTVYVSASDDSSPDNERLQYHATRLLYDAWWRAVYLSAHGTVRLVSQAWVIGGSAPRAERRYGAAIRVVGAIQAMIPDATPDVLQPPFEADITPSELDVTDTVIVVTTP